ncbi:hypothetical protein [Yonghaparkia sp. Soil809]|uniref:hypothetical protein n=1 Tax=Yonghaparkia sp. Soil809 TaxID=1736417 RepID=UPI0006FCD218|nr:hypothetical protein [Yonghaparkia sp. Soil809]KRF33570.1 hypothetical protein ASG83_06585 [Yonghaparkia sp. Soil809]
MTSTVKIIIAAVAGVAAIVVLLIMAPAIGDSVSGGQAQIAGADGAAVEFPVNERGETYGSANGSQVPDLLAAPTDDGQIGYVRVSELELARNVAGSLESGERVVDVYASDGETIIGAFTVTKDMPGPRAGTED